MPLINLKTDLKSLNFGKDRPEGASSNEPFITKDIPDERKAAVISDGGPDFMLRGGVLAPLRALDDAIRTTKLFLETPSGLLFTAKMNLLSRMAPKTIATQGAGYAGGNVNQGVYLPTSLIAQTGLAFSGTHTNTFGLNPFSPGQQDPSFATQLAQGGLVRYEDAILGIAGRGLGLAGDESPLTRLYDDRIVEKTNDPNVLSYSGGPGAELGIGSTDIKFSTVSLGQSRTGINNPYSVSEKNWFNIGERPFIQNRDIVKQPVSRENTMSKAVDYSTIDGFNGIVENPISDSGFGYEADGTDSKIYKFGTLIPIERNRNGLTSYGFGNTQNPTEDFIFPTEGTVNYQNISGFGGASGNEGYGNDIVANGGTTWTNIDAQKVYQSGSLDYNNILPTPNRPNGQTTDDFINPLSTNYSNIEGFGGENGNYEDFINKDGGYTWDNTDARRIYNSGSLTPIDNEITVTPQTTDDWVAPFVQQPTPAGPTRYTSMLNDGRSLNDVTDGGDVAWNDAQQKKTTAIRGNNPNTALMFNNNTVEVRSRYRGINIFSEVGEGDELNFRGLPLATKYPISNGFTKLAGVGPTTFNEGIARYNVNGGIGQSVYKNSIAFGEEGADSIESNVDFINQTGNGVSSWTQETIEGLTDSELYPQSQQIRDFRDDIDLIGNPNTVNTSRKVLGVFNGNYQNSRIENRVNSGDPGALKDVTDYTVGQGIIDKINAREIYEGLTPSHTGVDEDLCSFSIGYVKNDTSGNAFYMNFRAFLEDISDDYTADWASTQYLGRADKFYSYKGFDRSISLGWTVYAQSREELIPMYKKLNYLASGLAPTYSSGGFMQGNLARLTVGGYLYNQLGFIKSLSYNISKDSTWEIGINNEGTIDENVKQLPHMIKVTGFTFVPIQEFVPRIGNPTDLGKTPFISLKDGFNNNYESTEAGGI